jgi:membrane protein
MARAPGSHSRTADAQSGTNRAAVGDPAPETDEISGTRADYAPTGAEPKPTTGGTIKRTVKEFSEDNLTDWAAALTTTACWRCSPRWSPCCPSSAC